MTEAARVAVIIPCYNDGALVEEAFESIREHEPVDVVIVDDGSTDQEAIRRLAVVAQRGAKVIHSDNARPGAPN